MRAAVVFAVTVAAVVLSGVLVLRVSDAASVPGTPGFEVVSDVSYTALASYNSSTLYEISATDRYGSYRPLLLDLHGSRYAMGYAYGKLLAARIDESYTLFLAALLPQHLIDELLWALAEQAIDWQWSSFLSVELPEAYKDELRGIADGAAAAGYPLAGQQIVRVVVLANAPGDVQDFILVLIRELLDHHHSGRAGSNRLADARAQRVLRGMPESQLRAARRRVDALLAASQPQPQPQPEPRDQHCSMLAAWGSRTVDGSVFAARNLDWTKDTGINRHKIVVVYHPDDGSVPHATMGFVAMYGALAGMSAAGLTVHEANLEENEITFSGFPWVLRLRYVMENAHSLADAQRLWANTNNTVGFNHMVSSAGDHGALVFETKYDYTATFASDDAREADAMYTDPKTHAQTHLGAPLPEALWRTNHGYDPVIMAHFEWSETPTANTVVRYFLVHDALAAYEAAHQTIGDLQAMNITSIVADKGSAHPYLCEGHDGSNILSVVFHPSTGTGAYAYVAWEAGEGTNWIAAWYARA